MYGRTRRSAPAQTAVFHPVCKLYLGCPEGHAANRIFQDARPSGALFFLSYPLDNCFSSWANKRNSAGAVSTVPRTVDYKPA